MSQLAEASGSSGDIPNQVRSFYDRHPYPPPLESLEQYGRLWDDPHRRRADYHLFWPDKPYREDHSILIAGCGTSQAAKHALRFPAAKVTGIDISETSVRFTEELKRKYNLKNLEVRQLAVEQVNRLGMSFDQIVCTGVLHHLASPGDGLAALRGALTPDGAMHLMVYAPYGRTGVYMLQDFCRRLGIEATEKGIKDLLDVLRSLPKGHPLEHVLHEAPDFQQEAAVADALLHPQDRAYSVPELFEFVENAQLMFARWIRQAPYLPQCGVIAKLPQASRISQLPLKEQYAVAELFRGTMVRHSFIVYPKERLGGARPIEFAGDGWQGYVPIRMPDTLTIQERLPVGAAAVLINRNHTYRDIVLPIDATEMRLLEGVDGRRSIAEIIEAAPSMDRSSLSETARTLFEKLWRHDQVVFDASGVSA